MSTTELDYPQVAIDFMNHDHAQFAAQHSELLAAMDAGAAHAVIDSLLDALLHHSREHFAAEEALMQEVGFPAYPIHKGEHDRVLADMEQRAATWRSNRDREALHDWLGEAVADWFISHVSSMDFMTARFAEAARSAR